MAERGVTREMFLRTVAVVGLIAVLLLGAWGIILLAFNLPVVVGTLGGGAASLFTSTPKETLVVTAPQTVVAGQPLSLSWAHQGGQADTQYAYDISYSCSGDITLKAPLPNGSYQQVPCNTPFNYTSATDKVTLIPSGTGTINFTVTTKRLSDGKVVATNTGSTVIASATPATPSTPVVTTPPSGTTHNTPSYTYVPAAHPVQQQHLYGQPDLAVRVNSTSPASYGRTNVVFTVENIGTNVASRGWNLTAQLPLQPPYTYTSAPQQALSPGDKIVYTLSFDGGGYGYQNQYPYSGTCYYYDGSNNYPAPCSNSGYYSDSYYNQYPYNGNTYNSNYYGNGVVTITVDPWDTLQETNKYNNTATTNVR